jgi:hypothetical protein
MSFAHDSPDHRDTTDRAASDAKKDLRLQAIEHLRLEAEFRRHVLIYVVVNTFLVVIWFWTRPPVFWPIFPIAGWGIGLAVHAWSLYGHDRLSEQRIRREMERRRH